jgi:hypothetical protein
MRGIRPTVLVLAASGPACACASCRPQVAARVFDAAFFPTLLILLLPLGLVLAICLGLALGLFVPADPPEGNP